MFTVLRFIRLPDIAINITICFGGMTPGMREFQVRILAEVIFFAINSFNNLRGWDLLAPKIKIDMIFKLVIYFVESLTNRRTAH